MGSYIRNGINYSGGGSVSTDTTLTKLGVPADAKAVGDKLTDISTSVNGINMYYDPETDIKYLKNQDGEWVNVGYGGLLDKYLYSGSANEAEFVGFKGSISGVANTSTADSVPSVTTGSALTITSTGLSGCAISELIDFTEYTKLKFHHNSWASNNDYSNIHIAITSDKQQSMTPILVQKLVGKNTSLEADEEIDVSAINGSYYIVIHLNHNQSTGTPTTTSISDMYLTR